MRRAGLIEPFSRGAGGIPAFGTNAFDVSGIQGLNISGFCLTFALSRDDLRHPWIVSRRSTDGLFLFLKEVHHVDRN